MTLSLDDLRGRIVDLDTHEMTPTHLFAELFGEASARILPIYEQSLRGLALSDLANRPDSIVCPEINGDVEPVDPATIFQVKGCAAPGAFDLTRRAEVLDAMGLSRQIVFPGVGFMGFIVATASDNDLATFFRVDPAAFDQQAIGLAAVRSHNDWVLRNVAVLDPRVRPVGIVYQPTVPELVAEAERLIDGGVRILWIPSGSPLAGRSPAHPDLAPFWSLAERTNTPIVIHGGTGFAYYNNRSAWFDTQVFVPTKAYLSNPRRSFTTSTTINPMRLVQMPQPEENFTAAMVLGGVFERHPDLRFGVIEVGAGWVGPLAERMDFWMDEIYEYQTEAKLTMKPSEYLQRNVRVSPFYPEPVDRYIERYGLDKVYAYASDYPHLEGGSDPQGDLLRRLAPLGDGVVENFFVNNGELLLPA